MKLNRNTYKAQRMVTQYDCSDVTRLTECYGRYFEGKERAFNWCMEQYYKTGGIDFRILSYNTQMFTCGWLYADAETDQIMLRVETRDNSYEIEY